MASPLGNLNQTAIDDNENIELLSNKQLLSRSERYLNILQQRLHQPVHAHQIDSNQVEQLLNKKKKLAKIRSILAQFHDLVSSGHVRGFVYGLIDNDRSYTAASDNLQSWWKNVINFDKNGPQNLTIPNLETLSLPSLKDLHDASLSSLISTLLTVCTPSQRLFPFEAGVPVDWWPTGTEEWWAEMGFSENLEPPPYKKPHRLKKLWKVAVLAAIIKNIQPNFKLMRDMVAQAQTLQNKMSSRENDIWLAVLRGEELAMRQKLRLSASSNGEGSSRATSMDMAPEPEMVIGPIEMNAIDGESSGENNRSVSGEPEMAPATTDSVLAPQDAIEKSTPDGESSREPEMVPMSRSPASAQDQITMSEANSRKRIATSEPEIVSVSTSSAMMQGQIKTTAIMGESSGRRQKLNRIAVDVPELAPNINNQLARSLCQPTPASAMNFQQPSSYQQLSPMPIAAAGSQWPDMQQGNFLPGLDDSTQNQIQKLVRGNFHEGMANAGAANNNLFAPPFQVHGHHLPSPSLSKNYLQHLYNNNLQPRPMSIPTFSIPTPQPAEYYGVSSPLGSNNIDQVNSLNWATAVVPNVQAPLARLAPNSPFSPSHVVPLSTSQRNQLVRGEYSTPSAAEWISGDTGIQGTSIGATNSGCIGTPNLRVSNYQNQTQQATPISTNMQEEVMNDIIPQPLAQYQAPQAEDSLPISTGIQETSNAETNDDPLQQYLKSRLNEDMIHLDSIYGGFDVDGYVRQLASEGIKHDRHS